MVQQDDKIPTITSPEYAKNIFDFETVASKKLDPDIWHWLSGGADDMKTLQANRSAFDHLQIRARRLVNVSKIDTTIKIFDQTLATPIVLAPVGSQKQFNIEGELATARAAASRNHLMIASTVSSFSLAKITTAAQKGVWFQLYPTPDRQITRTLLQRAEDAGCPVVVLTVDAPVLGNREKEAGFRRLLESEKDALGNFVDLEVQTTLDPSLEWDFISWLKENTKMKIVIKGIVTHEDAKLCLENSADGIIISNHGGRQEESNRGTMECLPEIVEAIKGRIPILIDGGFRRGTDIFKALALGAQAICIGRPYLWGLASFGQGGVEKVLDLLQAELVRIMQLAGTPYISNITPDFIARK